MDTNTAVAPSPAPVPGAAPTPAMSQADVMAKLQAAAPDALNALLGANPGPAPATPATPAPAPTPANPEPPATPPVEATIPPPEPPATPPPVAPEPPVEETPQIPAKNYRVTPRDFLEAQVILLMKPKDGTPGLSLREAYEQVYGRPAPAAATPDAQVAPPPAPANVPTAAVDQAMQRTQQEIEALATQIEQKADEADVKSALKLQADMLRKESHLQSLKNQREAILHSIENEKVDAVVQQYQQEQRMSANTALEAYPQLADPKGEARRLYNEEVEAMRKSGRHNSVFDSPDWPALVAHSVAAKHGWWKGQPAATPPPAAPAAPPGAPPPAPRAPVTPNGAVTRATSASVIAPSAPTNGAAFAPTIENFRAVAHTFTPEALNKLLAGSAKR